MSDDDRDGLMTRPPPPETEARGLDMIRDRPSAMEYAKQIAAAKGLVPRALDTPEKIFLVLMAGRERNIGPQTALQHLHVVEGKVGMSYQLMLAELRKKGGDIEWVQDGSDGETASLRVRPPGASRFEDHIWSFTMQDAKRAGLSRRQSWQNYPANLLRARCLSTAINARCPEVTMGAYSQDEISEIESKSPRDEAEPSAPLPVSAPLTVDMGSAETVRAAQQEREKQESNALIAEWMPMIEAVQCEKEMLSWVYFHGFAASAMHPAAKQRLWTAIRKKCDSIDIPLSLVRSALHEAPSFPAESEGPHEPEPDDDDGEGDHVQKDEEWMAIDPETGEVFDVRDKVTFGKYEGLEWQAVAREYMRWLLAQEKTHDGTKARCRSVIAWKDKRDEYAKV